MPADSFARFVAIAKRRPSPSDAWKPPAGVDRKKADQDSQKADLERSLAYCRNELQLGARMKVG